MGGIATKSIRAARGVAAALRRPPYTAPGHYYSPATSAADRQRAVTWRALSPVGVDLNEDGQEKLAGELGPLMVDLPEDRWQPGNGMYGRADAATMHAMLRHYKPKRVVEVGSGYSTAVILDVAERYLPGLEVTCIEPYPERLLSRVRDEDNVHVMQVPVQQVPAPESLGDGPNASFCGIQSGDFLIIDSTHVAKSGSDVIWLYLHVLPTLPPGVLVHIHDIHWPFEYPEKWIREGRDWTEVYLLRAFLSHSEAWQIRLMTSWLWTQRPDLVPESLRGEPTGALWMQRQ
ncbi:class I SAM-dependent methyltransferase [Jiangella gansuensis]|uniref:class I SAM-dependent methyltransferase n=1 Tax=Jiangella gansuensis TaxID=281473 RepID=UPI00146FAD4F|nr:class I SAM-dependent methyltransferase [Jiangella gansuensis]